MFERKLNQLELRKQLLIAESEVNRTLLAREYEDMVGNVREVARPLRRFRVWLATAGWILSVIRFFKSRSGGVSILALAAIVLTGCTSYEMTNPPRSVTEQLLLSTAADRAINSISLAPFAGKRVFVDGAYYDSYDPKYVLGSIRDALSRAGALLVPAASNSDIIVEARSGGLSIDDSSTLVGMPQSGVPIPLAGTLSIPEIALYKASHQHSIAKLALLAYSAHTSEHFFSSGPMVGKSYNTYYKVLFLIEWTRTDIPEKKAKKHHPHHGQ